MRNYFLSTAVLMLAFSCSKKEDLSVSSVMHGACQVKINAKPKGSEILVDGIHVGEGNLVVNTPCGEKQITVHKHGYRPFREYKMVTKDDTLDVDVELKKIELAKDFALSTHLIEQIRKGVKIRNPFTPGGGAVESPSEIQAEAPAVAEAQSTDASDGGEKSSPVQGSWNSVEDWR